MDPVHRRHQLKELARMVGLSYGEMREVFAAWRAGTDYSWDEALLIVRYRVIYGFPLPWKEDEELMVA